MTTVYLQSFRRELSINCLAVSALFTAQFHPLSLFSPHEPGFQPNDVLTIAQLPQILQTKKIIHPSYFHYAWRTYFRALHFMDLLFIYFGYNIIVSLHHGGTMGSGEGCLLDSRTNSRKKTTVTWSWLHPGLALALWTASHMGLGRQNKHEHI